MRRSSYYERNDRLALQYGSERNKRVLPSMYGMPPGKISDELMQKAIGTEKPDFKRPGELLPPGIEPARQGCARLARVWEDVLTYALFPIEAAEFLKIKYGA